MFYQEAISEDARKGRGRQHLKGLKRGTVVRHPKYGRCTVGGFDRKKQTLSLHDYRSNKRLTQGAKVKTCRVLTWVAFRSWLVREKGSQGKGKPSTPAPNKERLLPPRVSEGQGYPQVGF